MRGRPAFRMRPPLDLGRRFHAAPAFADLDGDGRLDALLGQWGPRLAWYRGTAAGFEPVDTALVTITRGSNTVPALGDLDGDGDLDLLVGESSGWLNYYRNAGDTRAAPLRAGERRVRKDPGSAGGARRRSPIWMGTEISICWSARRATGWPCSGTKARGLSRASSGIRRSASRRRSSPRPRPGISMAMGMWIWSWAEREAEWCTWNVCHPERNV